VVFVHAGEQDVSIPLLQQHPLARSDLHPESGPLRLGRGHDQPVPERIGGLRPLMPLHRLIVDRGAGGELSGIDHGAHYCVGAHLGMLEVRVALAALLRERPGLRLAVPADDVRWTPGHSITTPEELPVEW
jgi:cytochrome P450